MSVVQHIIDVTQPPYNCCFDFTGQDSIAQDNSPGLEAAIYDASQITGSAPGWDYGGSIGNTILLPKGAGLFSRPISLPFGVRIRGLGRYSTMLKMADAFDPNAHFIDIGSSSGIACMGSGICDMRLYSRNRNAGYFKAMVYTRNAQDTDGIARNIIIQAGNRVGIRGEYGDGGASLVYMSHVQINTDGDLAEGDTHTQPYINPASVFKYGDGSKVILEHWEMAGPSLGGGPNLIGTLMLGGTFMMQHSHDEQIAQGVFIDLGGFNGNVNGGMAKISNYSGGNGVNDLVTIANRPAQASRIILEMISRNGTSNRTVFNALPGASHVMTDIVPATVF
jgi:hypothetical protein